MEADLGIVFGDFEHICSIGRTHVFVDSRHVAPADCLRVLGDAVRKRGELSTVLVFADERISFERMENLRRLTYKSGSANVRHFVFGSDSPNARGPL